MSISIMSETHVSGANEVIIYFHSFYAARRISNWCMEMSIIGTHRGEFSPNEEKYLCHNSVLSEIFIAADIFVEDFVRKRRMKFLCSSVKLKVNTRGCSVVGFCDL